MDRPEPPLQLQARCSDCKALFYRTFQSFGELNRFAMAQSDLPIYCEECASRLAAKGGDAA